MTTSRLRYTLASLATTALTVCALPALADIPDTERATLIALYESTQGDEWNDNGNWKTGAAFNAPGTECSWHGIVCADDRVTEMHLSVNNLVGTLPDLSALTALRRFNVSDNQLTGPLPSLAGLTALEGFWASNNQLAGFLPNLPELTALEYFWIMDNQLTGPIPDISAMATLRDFRVSTNRLTGVPPQAPAGLLPGGSSLCPNYLHAPSPSDAAWSAATGEDDWSRWCTPGYLVTPSAGPGGHIDPEQASALLPDETAAFTITADTGYLVDAVTSSCGGTLTDDTFITDPVTADCTVAVTFRAVPRTAASTPVPTLGHLGLLLMSALLAAVGAVGMRRRST